MYLVSKNIGTLWFGIGKVNEEKYHELDFVIIMAIAKVDSTKFRKNMFKSRRKTLEEIWFSDIYKEIGNIVRFAPSACTQSWKVIVAKEWIICLSL